MGQLKPDFKTIADFRRDNGPAIRKVCRQFIALCRDIDLLTWMGATHFRMKRLKHVATEMALHVLTYNITRVIAILAVSGLIKVVRAS